MIQEITRQELQQALEKRSLDHLFDARGEEAFQTSHILGAESLPAGEVEQGVGLPHNKQARIVFYCGNSE